MQKRKRLFLIAILVLNIIAISTAFAEIRLARVFSDNMVLQRGMEITMYGWADPGEQITVSIMGKDYKTRTNSDSSWSVPFPGVEAGGPYLMTIAGKDTIRLKNILFGDVWVCSGQSNMYFRVADAQYAYRDINDANYEKIRLFNIDNKSNHAPQKDLASGEWLECTPESVPRFSAVAYFFGRELHRAIDVPIGLIHGSWGGANIQSWMDGSTLKRFDKYRERVEEIEKTPDYFENLQTTYKENGGSFFTKRLYKLDPGFRENGKLTEGDFFSDSGWKNIPVPGYWEDMELPDYNGTVWYRRQFVLPEMFQNKDLELDLGWIDDYDFTFFNGDSVGRRFYQGLERRYKIPKESVKKGLNEIEICVYDAYGKGGFWGPRKSHLRIAEDSSLVNIDLQGFWQYKIGIPKKTLLATKLPSNPYPVERNIPSLLYNAMIAPLTSYPIKGAIWYQGESNAGNAAEYQQLLPAMIKGWRSEWQQGDFPFLIVQLANYGMPSSQPVKSNWAELREAQLKTLSLPGTGIAVAIDLGDAMDVHPTDKQSVGQRLVLAARKVAYHEKDIVYSGPIYKSMQIKDGKVYLSFDHIGSGMVVRDKHGYLKEFSLAGKDKKFVWANAYIEGDRVVVYHKDIKHPLAVRFGWSNNPAELNLYNKEGLPASSFRTDEFDK